MWAGVHACKRISRPAFCVGLAGPSRPYRRQQARADDDEGNRGGSESRNGSPAPNGCCTPRKTVARFSKKGTSSTASTPTERARKTTSEAAPANDNEPGARRNPPARTKTHQPRSSSPRRLPLRGSRFAIPHSRHSPGAPGADASNVRLYFPLKSVLRPAHHVAVACLPRGWNSRKARLPQKHDRLGSASK